MSRYNPMLLILSSISCFVLFGCMSTQEKVKEVEEDFHRQAIPYLPTLETEKPYIQNGVTEKSETEPAASASAAPSPSSPEAIPEQPSAVPVEPQNPLQTVTVTEEGKTEPAVSASVALRGDEQEPAREYAPIPSSEVPLTREAVQPQQQHPTGVNPSSRAAKLNATLAARASPNSHHRYRILLSSVRTEAAAKDAKNNLSSLLSAELSGLALLVQRVDLHKKGVTYRILTSFISRRETADDVCTRVQRTGRECLVLEYPAR